ncbi:MAG: hypothetical protein ACYTEZ_11560 [Planctomycetota bacterium]|jgi:hypothetical protein
MRGGAPSWRWSLCLVLGLAACREGAPRRLQVGGGPTAAEEGLILGFGQEGAVRFARRIDGSIAAHRRMAVTDERAQYLLITSKEPGQDQCKILVLDDDGALAAQYRISGVSPFPYSAARARYPGETSRHLQAPVPEMVIPFRWRGRRLIAIGTRNNYSPSSLVLLEAPARDRLEERLTFWNFGHIHFVVEAAPYLVILGFSNRLGQLEHGYPHFAAVFHLDDLAWEGAAAPRVQGISPAPEDPPAVANAPYRHYICFPQDRVSSWVNGEIRDGVLYASTTFGLTYAVDLATASVKAEPAEVYRSEYPQRRARDPDLPALEEHLARLVDAVRVWSRAP